MITLNNGQQTAVDAVVSGFLEHDVPGLTIIGEGGTGKTTCVMSAVQRLLDAGLKVLFCAPTNKAVKQGERSAREFGLSLNNIAFQTLHSALGLSLLPDEENKFAAQLGKGVFDLFDVCVCDEASMLSKIVLNKYLLPAAEEHNVKLLLMGDDMQLPPVKEPKSLAFEVFPCYRLSKVERQDESSEILTVTGLLRTAIDTDKMFKHPQGVAGAVEDVQAVQFLKTVVESFDLDTDLDKQRVLAWRNRRVDEINAAIRRKIYGREADRFEVGERVVTGAPIKGDSSVILSTAEECIVKKVAESSVYDEDSDEDYKTHLLVLSPIFASGTPQVMAHVLHESEEERYWGRLNELATKAKAQPSMARNYWARYHQFKDLFATIKYCYCLTVHSSQGSTYDTVFVDVKDILANNLRRERQRLLYVAYSRPRKRLVINKRGYVA